MVTNRYLHRFHSRVDVGFVRRVCVSEGILDKDRRLDHSLTIRGDTVQHFGTQAAGAVRVVIVDATRLASESLAEKLQKDGCKVVYAGTSAPEARVYFANADVALVSAMIEDNDTKGYELAGEIRKTHPNLKVIIVVNHSDPLSVVQAFRSGARGILGRDASLDSLSKCIARVHEGQVWANSREMHHLLQALSAPPRMRIINADGNSILTPREQEVVHWAAEGLSNREIGEQLQLSENTVKNYLFRIFDKLGVSSRVELILYAVSQDAKTPPAQGVPTVVDCPAPDHTPEHRACEEALEKSDCPFFILGEMYRDGRGVPADSDAALMWFTLSEIVAKRTLNKGAFAIADLERALTPERATRARRNAQLRAKQSNPCLREA